MAGLDPALGELVEDRRGRGWLLDPLAEQADYQSADAEQRDQPDRPVEESGRLLVAEDQVLGEVQSPEEHNGGQAGRDANPDRPTHLPPEGGRAGEALGDRG